MGAISSVGGVPLGLMVPHLCGWLQLPVFVRVPQQYHLHRCEPSLRVKHQANRLSMANYNKISKYRLALEKEFVSSSQLMSGGRRMYIYLYTIIHLQNYFNGQLLCHI